GPRRGPESHLQGDRQERLSEAAGREQGQGCRGHAWGADRRVPVPRLGRGARRRPRRLAAGRALRTALGAGAARARGGRPAVSGELSRTSSGGFVFNRPGTPLTPAQTDMLLQHISNELERTSDLVTEARRRLAAAQEAYKKAEAKLLLSPSCP